MNKFKRTIESLSILIIVILSIPAVSESSNIIPHAAAQVVPAVPLPPTGLTTPFVSSSQISISWHAPLNGVYPVTGYQIERSTDGGTTWNIIVANTGSTGTWYSNYHLLGSTAYSYRVSAINSIGTSSPSNTASATTSPATVPNPPTGLATPFVSSSQISISWQAPLNDGGSPITGYKIESSTDGGTTWNIIVANTGLPGTWYSNYHLLGSTAYSYRVSTINGIGTGTPSSTVSATTLAPTAPQPPTGLSAPFVSSSQISISWAAPFNDGGAPITGYKIESSTDGGTTWTTIAPNVAPSPRWYSNYHLLGGTAYSYRISAINSVGTSSPSNTASATTSPATAPDPPTGLATPFVSSSQISISWFAPSNNGGSPITGYKIESSTDGGTNWNIVAANTGSTGTWYSNYNLLAGTTYTFRISAINSVGTSLPSSTVSATTSAVTVPNPPTGLATVYVSSSQISISWFAPSNNGGSPITGYKIERSVDGGTTWTTIAPNVAPSPRWYSNYHLLGGTAYSYRVSAINGIGTSSPSNTASATTSPATAPDPPTGLATVYVSSSQISISWFAPSNNGGSPITGYKVERSTDGGTTWNIFVANTAKTITYKTNYQLLASTTYSFRISAINSAGTSLPSSTFSETTKAATAPDQPTGLAAAFVSSSQISISWASPFNNGGSPITGYKIERSTDGGTSWNIVAANTGSTGTWYSNYNLLASTAYSYRVSAINSAGTGSPSSTASATTHATQTISLNPTTGPPGSSITVTGANFGSPSKITILYDNTVVTTNPATITTDSSGGFTATFTEPLPAAGPHTVTAKDAVSNLASAKFTVFTAQIYKIQSGLVTSDSLITGDLSNWLLAGDAVAANAPHSGTEDSSGLHIGILTTAEGTFHGFEAISPLTTAHLFHAKITLPTARPTTTGGVVDMDLYTQQEVFQNPHINAIGCGATLYSDKVDWKTVVQQGNDKVVTSVQTVYINSDPTQPTSRDCTFVTDGNTMLKAYLDGQQVVSSSTLSLNMPQPFQTYLELQTNSKSPSTGQSYIGTFTDYYATTSDSIKVIHAQAGSIVKVVNATSGSTLASSTADSSGTALVDVGKYHMPINANVVVYDSTGTNILDSTVAPAGIYGGDVYSVGDSTVPQTTITVNGFDSTTNAPLQGIYTTISTGQTNVATGFLPITYTGSTYAEYTIIPQNYGTQIFDHWDDGSIDRARILDPTASSATVTAYYVDAHPTSTDVEPNVPTVQEGHQITFTVTVADQYAPSSIPPGTVAFDDGTAGGSFSSPSCTLDSTGACTITYTVPSKAFSFPITITGKYLPSDTIHHGSSATSSLTVAVPPPLHQTSTDISPDPSSVSQGHQITFTATIKDQSGSPTTPAGTVAFDDSNSGGSFSSPSCTLDSTGACTITYTANAVAPSFPVTITGTYSPSDSTHQGSSGTSTLTVSPPAVLLSPTSGLAGATVSVSGKGFAANSAITISFDGTNVSTNPATMTTGSSGDFSSATFTVPSSATVGKHTVSATDGSFTGSAQFTVKDTSALNITTEDSFGKTITGYFIILTQSGTTVASGFSPVTFTLTNGAQYSVGAGSFGNVVFDHWKDNGSTANPRLISISSDTALTAVYRTSAISLNPTEGPAGEPVTVSGNTFAPNSAITISYDGTSVPTSPATITTNSGGSFTATFTVPASAVGAHTVSATDASSNSASAQFTLSNKPAILLSPTSGGAGSSVTVSGINFSPSSTVTLSFDTTSVSTNPVTITTGSSGGFSGVTFTVPASSTGPHTVNATDASSKSASAQFTVTTTSTLTVTSEDMLGNTITGYHVSLSQGGTTVGSGFTPVSLTVNDSVQYSLDITSFQPYVFDHWKDNGSTADPRSISINADTHLIAVYRHTALALNPSMAPVSTVVTMEISGFPANAELHLLYDGASVSTTPATMTTNSAGNFTATFTVPSSTAGAHTVIVEEGPDPTDKSATAQFTLGQGILLNPTSATNGGEVKVTGADFTPNSKITMNFDTDVISPVGDPGSNPLFITTDSSGSFVALIQVPWVPVGAHTISATDQTHTSTMGITVTPASLLFDPSTGHAGTTVNFHASGFAANSAITITLDGTAVATTPSPLTTSAEGEAPGSFTIPTSATVGAHPIQISDASGHVYSTSFTVTDPTSPVFSTQDIVTGLPVTQTSQTDGMAFISDKGPGVDGSGSFMVLLKGGTVIVINNTGTTFVKQSVPFVTVPTVQGYNEDAGLLGIAIDPHWTTTHQVYFFRTASINGVLQNEIVRYTATTDTSGNIVADTTKGEELILGGIPATASHNSGHMKFDKNNNLYIAVGDGFYIPPAGQSQNLTSLAGKILRITPLATPGSNGLLYSIPSTNPFASSTDPAVKKEIYSYGVRNVFSFDIDSTGTIYANQIGYHTWESLYDATTPGNFGWYPYEGPTIGNPQNLANYKEPIYWYPHAGIEPNDDIEAMTGGAFYHSTGTQYPSQLQGAYFFGDYGVGYIVAVLPTGTNPMQTDPVTGVPKAQVQTIVTGLSFAPIDMSVWNGKLYYVTLTGSVDVLNYS